MAAEESVQNLNRSLTDMMISPTKSHPISQWNLPHTIEQAYAAHGITHLFPWQLNCLSCPGVLKGKNLIYSAPTSAGKTFVAEILMLKTVIEKEKKAIFILPYKALVKEKTKYLQELVIDQGLKVGAFMGKQSPPGGLSAVDIAVCVIEKGNSLLNRLLEEGSVDQLGIVVIDELHQLSDSSRGYLLELLINKLLFIQHKVQDLKRIQIVGLSATLPNISTLAKWLDATLYVTDFRPVPFYQHVLYSRNIYNSDLQETGKVSLNLGPQSDAKGVSAICLQTVLEGHSALVFCSSKTHVETVAILISKSFFVVGSREGEFGDLSGRLKAAMQHSRIAELLEQLKSCPVGLQPAIRKAVTCGVGIHHAGLSEEEREIQESAFRRGCLRVMVATSTLCSGVNLPARTVLVMYSTYLTQLMYQQMAGRAGRMGMNSQGDSYLVFERSEDVKKATALMAPKLDLPIKSCLWAEHGDASSLRQAALELIACEIGETLDDLRLFLQLSLHVALMGEAQNKNQSEMALAIDECIDFLKSKEFIRCPEADSQQLVATRLGKACLAASMTPEDALELHAELERAQSNFVLSSELHLLYLAVPQLGVVSPASVEWFSWMNQFSELPEVHQKVAKAVGVTELFIQRQFRNPRYQKNPCQAKLMEVARHQRFRKALALLDLVNEVPLDDVARKMAIPRGEMQRLQQSASMQAGRVTAFCRELGWHFMEVLMSTFQDRLQFGVQPELCQLMRVSVLNGHRARALYDAGFTDLSQLAHATVDQIEKVLIKLGPFQAFREQEGEGDYNAKVRRQMKSVFVTGQEGLNEREAALLIRCEARQLLQEELKGIAELVWSKPESSETASVDNKQEENLPQDSEVNKCMEVDDQIVSNFDQCENKLSGCIKIKYEEHVKLNTASLSQDKTTKVESVPNMNTSVSSKATLRIEEESNKENVDPNCSTENNETMEIVMSPSRSCISPDMFAESPSKPDSQSSNLMTVSDQTLVGAMDDFDNLLPKNTEPNNVAQTLMIAESSNNDAKNEQHKQMEIVMSRSCISPDIFAECPSQPDSQNSNPLTISDHTLFGAMDDFDKLLSTNVKACEPTTAPTTPQVNYTFSNDTLIELMDDFENLPPSNKECANEILSQSCCSSPELIECSPLSETHSTDRSSHPSFSNRTLFELMEKVEHHTCVSPEFTCVSLKSAFCKLSHFDIIDSDSCAVLKSFISDVQTSKNVSVSFLWTKASPMCIGADIVGVPEASVKIPVKYYSSNDLTNKRLVGLAVHLSGFTTYYLDLLKLSDSDGIDIANPPARTSLEIRLIQKLLCNTKCALMSHNIKITLLVLKKLGLDLGHIQFGGDPLVATWLLNSEQGFQNVLKMSEIWCPKALSSCWELVKLDKCENLQSEDLLGSAAPCVRASVEVYLVSQLCLVLHSHLEQHLLFTYYMEVELPVMKILACCEVHGLMLDHLAMKKMIDHLDRRLNFMNNKTKYKSLQVEDDIFDYEKIEDGVEGDQNQQTNDMSLYRRLHFILTKILRPIYRQPVTTSGRLYSMYTTLTLTGRMYSKEPSVQSIPRNFEVLQHQVSPRSLFTAAEDHVLIAADYKQMEVRLLAHFSRDHRLVEVLGGDLDIFRHFATQINRCSYEEVGPKDRQVAKKLVYSLLYGISSEKFVSELKTDRVDADRIINSFRMQYPVAHSFMNQFSDICIGSGQVRTLFGRYRLLRSGSSNSEKAKCKRQATNTLIQGSAADIVKQAMVKIDAMLIENELAHHTNLVLQLHDELIYEARKCDATKVASIVKLAMETAVKLTVPFPVTLNWGSSWGNLQQFNFT